MRKLATSTLAVASVLAVALSSSPSHAFGGHMGFGGFRGGAMSSPGFATRMGGFGRPTMGGGFGGQTQGFQTNRPSGFGGWGNRTSSNATVAANGGFPRPGQVAGGFSNGGRSGGLFNIGQQGGTGNFRGGQTIASNAPATLPMQVRPMPVSQPTQVSQPVQSSSSGSGVDQTVQSIGSTITSVLGTIGTIAAFF